MLLSESAYLSKGVVGLIISYEDKLILFLMQYICQRRSEEVVNLLIPDEDKLM